MKIRHLITWQEGERLQSVIRRHGVTIFWPLLGAACVVVLPFFLLFWLFKQGSFGIGLFFVCEVFGLWLAGRTWYLWDGDVLLITNHRLIRLHRHGFFGQSVRDLPLSMASDIQSERRGWGGAIWRFGKIRIRPPEGSAGEIELLQVPQPERIRQLILSLREKSESHLSSIVSPREDSDVRETAYALLDQASEEVLQELVDWLKERIKEDDAGV